MNGCYDLRIRSDLNQGKKLVGTAKKTRIRNTDTQMLLLPALSDKVPSLFSLNGAPPPLHSSYISGSQTQPSRSNTRHRGNIFKRWRAMASRIDITLVKSHSLTNEDLNTSWYDDKVLVSSNSYCLRSCRAYFSSRVSRKAARAVLSKGTIRYSAPSAPRLLFKSLWSRNSVN